MNPSSSNLCFPSAGCGGLRLGQLKFPRYSGKLADYPTWKEDWRQLIHSKVDAPIELIRLRDAVPKEAQVELKTMRTLEEAWRFLDEEFGQVDQLTAERISFLHAFQPSEGARTDHAKFRELHAVWREVFTDLDKVDVGYNLNNALVLESFIRKFPRTVKRRRASTPWDV